jgi:lipid II:glycine glycyltransferase (peptidoglycan interpeptide bridge formation enzyme)
MDIQPYLTSSDQWLEFWKSAQPTNHSTLKVTLPDKNHTSSWLYVYPWVQNKRFAYASRIYSQTPDMLIDLIRELINKSKEAHCSFLQFDLDAHISTEQADALIAELKKMGIKVKPARKSLQYHQTIVVNCTDLHPVSGHALSDISKFYQLNTHFFSLRSTKFRRYAKKSLQAGLDIKIGGKDLFFDFWTLLSQTAVRQGFHTHQRSYYETLIQQLQTHIIVAYHKQIPVAAWLGIINHNSLYYLYGGTSADGFAFNAQYLIQLTAFKLASEYQVQLYDLGGYDSSKGYGTFKECLHGEIISFPGEWEIPISPDYFVNNMLLRLKSRLQNKK